MGPLKVPIQSPTLIRISLTLPHEGEMSATRFLASTTERAMGATGLPSLSSRSAAAAAAMTSPPKTGEKKKSFAHGWSKPEGFFQLTRLRSPSQGFVTPLARANFTITDFPYRAARRKGDPRQRIALEPILSSPLRADFYTSVTRGGRVITEGPADNFDYIEDIDGAVAVHIGAANV